MNYPKFTIHQGDCLAWLSAQKAGSPMEPAHSKRGPQLEASAQRPDSYQLFVLDPPYNVGFRYNHYRDTKPYRQYLFEQLLVLTHCARLLKPGGSVFYLNYPETAADIWGEVDFLERVEWLPWVYHSHLGGWPLRRASRAWLWLSKGEPLIHREAFEGEYRNPEDPRIKARIAKGLKPNGYDWMDTGQVRNTSREKREHPCQVPESMVERFILGTTNPGDLVGDCYTGSGTTGICAIRHGREFSGCELDPTYIQVAQKVFDQELLAKGIIPVKPSESNLVEIRRVI